MRSYYNLSPLINQLIKIKPNLNSEGEKSYFFISDLYLVLGKGRRYFGSLEMLSNSIWLICRKLTVINQVYSYIFATKTWNFCFVKW